MADDSDVTDGSPATVADGVRPPGAGAGPVGDGEASDAAAGEGDESLPVPAEEQPREQVESPAKLMRVGSMIKQLLEEVRNAPLDDRSRERMKDIYQSSVRELGSSLSPDLREELASFTLPFDDSTPSDAELRVAQAQLVGWLEGLFHGIQATLFAQQAAAARQLEQVRGGGGPGPGGMVRKPSGLPDEPPPGTYL